MGSFQIYPKIKNTTIMLSLRPAEIIVAPPTSSPIDPGLSPPVVSFPNLQDSLDTYVNLLLKELGSHPAVKLFCSLPDFDAWAAGTTLDHNDLHQLRANLFDFLHQVQDRLRAQSIHASYHVSPCQNDSAFALVRAMPAGYRPVWTSCLKEKQKMDIQDRFKVFVATLGGCPTLILS
ncbi:uncharacterized protein EI90DRAFT_1641838 [Cantharellus anzutake]|uniref:uncharacterized protein n=1 Tax=Cantharellus anzutake TaxID=1750568 RepID=UPI00190746C5|nr:uncharacterized protein EI90DRAFT_1641838 [Cantharellus anzutake]KAF8327920.1 hypothetical protein EI90DRAFT_1641838 [Cantharellus anzutake]